MTVERDEALRYVLEAVRTYNDRARADGFEDPKIDEALAVLEGEPEPVPPVGLADAWERFQRGGAGAVTRSELTRIDEWREEAGVGA